MGELKDLPVEKFAADTASSAPVPGGGSVSALTGALAAALAEMVANLTIGKEKYAQAEEEMRELSAAGASIRRELIAAMKKDSESFSGYMNALKLPKGTDEQKEIRKAALQQGLKDASQAPLAAAKAAARIFPIAEAVVERGNKGAVSDGLIAAMLARTAVIGALLNVKINLKSIHDEEYVREMTAVVRGLEREALDGEARVLALSDLGFEKGGN